MLCLYQKSVCKEYRTRLQSANGFLTSDQRHFLSLYSYSLDTLNVSKNVQTLLIFFICDKYLTEFQWKPKNV